MEETIQSIRLALSAARMSSYKKAFKPGYEFAHQEPIFIGGAMPGNDGHHASSGEVKSLLEQKESQISGLKRAVLAGEESGDSPMTLREITAKRKQEIIPP